MSTLSDFQLSRVIALETVPSHVGRKQVIGILGRYGRIIDIQFWTSSSGKKHGFVTFEEPEDATTCLSFRDTFTPRLNVKPVNPTTTRHYRIPQGFPHDPFEVQELLDDSSPSLASRFSLPSEPTTPPRQPHTQTNPYASMSRPDLNAVAAAFTQPAEPRSISSLPSGQAQSSSTTSAFPQVMSKPPSTNSLQLPPISSPAPRGEHDLETENRRLATEIKTLRDERHNLHSSLQQIKQDRDIALKQALDDADRYRTQRDNLSIDLKIASEDAKHYKIQLDGSNKQCEELNTRLIHEGNLHRRQEGDLRVDLRSSRDEMFRWRKECQNAQAELAENRQKLHDLENVARRGRTPADERQTKGTMRHGRKISEPEEGQLSPYQTPRARLPDPANPPPSNSQKQSVIPALEKAFLRLDEITTDALRGSQKKEEQETMSANKRQRIGDS